jgi:hypothetical protein
MENTVTEEELQEFCAKATEHFQEVDPLTQVVLRGHLLLEERLNAIVKNSLYNPAFAEKLNFHHKLLFARAFTVSQRGDVMWDLLAAINVLRNSIAHSLDAEQRRKKFQTVKALYLRELEDPELKKEDQDEPDHLLFLKAYALCEGYIRRAQQDAEMVGGMIRRMIGAMRNEFYRQD